MWSLCCPLFILMSFLSTPEARAIRFQPRLQGCDLL